MGRLAEVELEDGDLEDFAKMCCMDLLGLEVCLKFHDHTVAPLDDVDCNPSLTVRGARELARSSFG